MRKQIKRMKLASGIYVVDEDMVVGTERGCSHLFATSLGSGMTGDQAVNYSTFQPRCLYVHENNTLKVICSSVPTQDPEAQTQKPLTEIDLTYHARRTRQEAKELIFLAKPVWILVSICLL
jgi:hypothetical protein